MKPKTILRKMAVLVATMMCALGSNAQEAYACYTSSNTTLTFYYDDLRSSREGTTYDLNTGKNDPGWFRDGINAGVTEVVFDPSFADARPKTTYGWFNEMYSLQSITNMSYLNTSEVTNMDWMFAFCGQLTSLDLSHFNTSKVTSMNSMFASCDLLKILDLSSFSTSKVTNMYQLFSGDWNLETIYVGSGWSTDAVTESFIMFGSCTSLVGGKGTTYDANHIDKAYAHIDGGTSNRGYLTDATTREAYICYTDENTTLTFYYDHKRSSRTGTIYGMNTEEGPGWYTDGTYENVTKVVFDPSFANARPTTTYGWFNEMYSLQSITGLSYLNTSEVTNMSWMFADSYMLESLDVSHFNTVKVTDMSYMFRDCKLLESLDVSHFNTSKVTNMESMFDGLTALKSLDVSRFNTANVENMSSMFSDCHLLTSLDVSSFNTANVTDMSHMFRCRALTSLDLSSFDTSNVTDMNFMFYGAQALTSLDLSSFNTAKVTSMGMMFFNCMKLESIFVGDGWSTAAVTESGSMFSSCNNLVGGQGTTYSSSNPTDKTYARIDGGPSNPGYFTEWKEAYACYTPENTTLTFYYDTQRSSRTGTTYDLNTGSNDTGWDTDDTQYNVTQVVFDPSFADARPTTTYDWFYSMENLQSITGMGYLNTSEVTNMGYMFCNCILLKSIDLSHFDTSKVTSMKSLFTSCHLLTSLDVCSFNTSNVTKMSGMFESCEKLQTIYVGDGWSTAKVTESASMFADCNSLKGGQGTAYNDSNPKDKTYAHVDGGPNNPGYFTYSATGIATSIEAVPVKANTVKGIYTLDGRKLNELPTKKGVYIVGGKKVVVK